MVSLNRATHEEALQVDVIIAAWNREDTIERAITSALAEPEVQQVIVVDDCSSDKTWDKVSELASLDSRIVVHRQSVNGGPSAARNVALDLSKAPWVAVLDADDFFLPGRIKELSVHFGNVDLVADNILQVSDGDLAFDMEADQLISGIDKYIEINLYDFVVGNISNGSKQRKELGFLKPILRRKFLDEFSLSYNRNLRLGEDYELYARMLANGARFRVIPSQGYVSVIRSDSISGRHSQQDLQQLRDCDLALLLLQKLTDKERAIIQRHYENIDARVQWLSVIQAVKTKSLGDFQRPFFRSWGVTVFLLQRIWEQLVVRSGRWWSLS